MSSSIKSLLTGTLAALSIGVVGASDAMAVTVTGTLTADNHYGLLYGNEDGSELNLVGRNEYGRGGNPGRFNWSVPETWNFDVSSQDYIYVVTWDDGGVDASWIGEFTFDNGEKLLSKAGSWEYILSSGPRPGLPGEVPDNAELFDEISNVNWVNAQSRGPNGTGPWGMIPGITPEADFLTTANINSGLYAIFRTNAPVPVAEPEPVPEPTSVVGLLAAGALGASVFGKRRQKKA